GVARRQPPFSLESLRERYAHPLGGIAPETDRLSGNGDRRGVGGGHIGFRLKVEGDNRRKTVPDAAQWPDTGEEREQGRRGRDPEAEALALVDEAAVGVPVSNRERARRAVRNAERGLQLPGTAEECRQVDPGVPVEGTLEVTRK